MNLPNALTVIRILLVPLFLYEVLKDHFSAATVVYLAAAFTDGLDGFIARVWRMQTRLGTFLDPLADKLLVTASYLVLAYLGVLPLWLSLAVISRDIIIVLGSLVIYLLLHHLVVKPHPLGKITTFFQFAMMLITLVLQSDWTWASARFLERVFMPLAVMTAVLTVLSGAVYILQGFRVLEEGQ